MLGSLLVLLGPSACFDPDNSPLDGGEASTGAASTTSGPPSSDTSDGGSATSTTSGSSGAQGSSSGAVTGLDSGTEGTSTGEPVVESSSSGEPSTSSGESSTGEEPSTDGYGDCENNPPAAVCLSDEQCLDFGNVSVCAEQSCLAVGDCAVPPTGNPSVVCTDVDGNGSSECHLECTMGEACPDGMDCYGGFLCMWHFAGVPGVCPDQDLGSAVPQAIMGNNTGLGDDHFTSCGTGGGDDATYAFTAPIAGTYVFDTVGTAFDTILAALDSCGGTELTCNDDSGGFLTSQIMVALAAGQTVIIVVDGYGAATGPFNLNIGVL